MYTPQHNLTRSLRYRLNTAFFIVCLLMGSLSIVSTACADDHDYIMGIVPYFTASRLEEIYVPVAIDLGKTLNRKVRFRTASNFDKYFFQLKDEVYDIALVHPLFYVPAVDNFNYLPLVRMQEPFQAMIVVPEQSNIQTVTDLKGKVLATPPPFLPAVHLIKKALRDNGIIPGKDIFLEDVKAVDSCLQQMLIGKSSACVAPPFAYEAFQNKTGARLRIILKSDTLPNLAFVVHKRVPQHDQQLIRESILAWGKNENGRAVLTSINTQSFVTANDTDFNSARKFVNSLDEAWLPSSTP